VILEISQLTKRFLGITAVDQVDLGVERGEIVGLIGPNGSGKTTLFNCVTGLLPSNHGTVILNGIDITHEEPHKIIMRGMSRTFQTVRVFAELTVKENLLVATQQHQEDSLLQRMIRTPSIKKFEMIAASRADWAINFVGLDRLKDCAAGTLSYGQRKLLAFATCFISEPELILLDEPAAAVNPTMINKMAERIRYLNKQGTTFLIVEHNMEFIMNLANRIVVLDQGKKIAEGFPNDIQKDERVLNAYFGE
jgi:branched-chain amino acid transport system ATP-binding protein